MDIIMEMFTFVEWHFEHRMSKSGPHFGSKNFRKWLAEILGSDFPKQPR